MANQKYAIFIAVDEPKGTKASYGYATGGWVAAPAVARVVRAMASVLGLKPKGDVDLVADVRPYLHKVSAKGGAQ